MKEMGFDVHFLFLIIFLTLFSVMAVAGVLPLLKQKRVASSIFILVCASVFGISTYLAATL